MHQAMNQLQLLAGDPRTGSLCIGMTSSQVTKTFTSMTPHRIEIEPWSRYHCVCLVKTHRLTCNMTYLDHLSGQVIWPELWSNFQIDFPGSKCIPMCRCTLKRGILLIFAFFFLSFLAQNLYAKSKIFQNSNIFVWPTPGPVKCDLRWYNRVWLDSEHRDLSVCLCGEALFQLGANEPGGSTPPP